MKIVLPIGRLGNRLHEFRKAMRDETMYPLPSGSELIDLSLGEPQEEPPVAIQEASKDAWRCFLYPPGQGMPALREEISNMFFRDFGAHYPASEIVVTAGARGALSGILESLRNSQKSIMISRPSWSGYAELIHEKKLKYQSIPSRDNCMIDIGQMIDRMDDDTGAVIVNWSNNPSGECLSKEGLEAILRVTTEHKALMVLDIAYHRYTTPQTNKTLTDFISKHHENPSLVPVKSFSKSLCVCGLRVGCVPTKDKTLCEQLSYQVSMNRTGESTVSQYLVLKGISAIREHSQAQAELYIARRHTLNAILGSCPKYQLVEAQGGIYQYVDISQFGLDSQAFCIELRKQTGVCTAPGLFFGLPGRKDEQDRYVRLSLVQPKEKMVDAGRWMVDFANGYQRKI